MKKIISSFTILICLFLVNTVQAQTQEDKLDLPGDNLNLYAVMKLFQESPTLESFEKKLNEDGSQINNLDLDGDEKTDYIKVIDNVDGDVHTIVLQVDINATEKQDVAVFTVQKDGNDKTEIQLIGDEELYGKDYIIEPNMDDAATAAAPTETPNPGYSGKTTTIDGEEIPVTTTSPVVINSWPIVQYIYLPTYTVWHSPWSYGYYPSYWRPWRPVYWHQYWGYQHNWNYYYYGHYRRWNVYRYPRYNDYYYRSVRVRSPFFYQRRQSGFYRTTYSKPESRLQGEAAFRKNNPGINRRPVTGRPVTRPVTRPTTPRPTNPGNIKPVRPVTKPTVRPGGNEGIKPTRPATIKPTRPTTRPTRQSPALNPGRTKTSTRTTQKTSTIRTKERRNN